MASVLAQDLRKAALQAAFEGKLSTFVLGEELPVIREDGNELLLFVNGNEFFELPNNWRWVSISQIASTSLGKTLNRTKDTGDVVPYLCSINVYWNGITLDEIKTARFTLKDIEKYYLAKGDLLICEGGDCGRSAVWEHDIEMYYQNALHRVRFEFDCDPYFYLYVLRYYKEAGFLDAYTKGQTIKHLVQKSLYSIPFPLPPIEEQHRIVNRVNEIMVKIDELEAIQEQIKALY